MSQLVKKLILLAVIGWLSLLLVAGFVTKRVLEAYVVKTQQKASPVSLELIEYHRRLFTSYADVIVSPQNPTLQEWMRHALALSPQDKLPSLKLHVRIAHGPVILSRNLERNFRPRFGLGLLTVNIEVPEKSKQQWQAWIGKQSPLEIQTLVTFWQNFKTTWRTAEVRYQENNPDEHFIWPGAYGSLRIARKHSAIEKNVVIEPLDIAWQNGSNHLHVVTEVLHHQGKYAVGKGGLWYGESKITLPQLRATKNGDVHFAIDALDLHYRKEAELETFSFETLGKINKIQFGAKDIIGPFSWDVVAGHLDVPLLADAKVLFKSLNSQRVTLDSLLSDALVEHVVKNILQRGADFHVRQFELQTPIGHTQFQGEINLPVREQVNRDMPWLDILLQGEMKMKAEIPGPLLQGVFMMQQWMQRITASPKTPVSSVSFLDVTGINQLQQWQEQGLIEQKNGNYVSQIHYKNGVWHINNKVVSVLPAKTTPLSPRPLAYIQPIKMPAAFTLPDVHEFDDE